MPEPDFFIKEGDTASIITSTLRDDDLAAVDIQGATVRFHLAPISGSGTPVLNAAAVNDQVGSGTDGSKGKVSYAWVAGNTGFAGLYLGEWEVTYAGGKVQSFPNSSYILVRIKKQVA